jgi:very-short-patch-repair endonuclease
MEARAVSEASVTGYLHERICYRWFTSRARFVPGIDFDFQSSQEGGRLELGGMVVDFIFPLMMIAFNVQGPQHMENLRKKKDEEQYGLLRDMGYWPVNLPISVIQSETEFDRTMYNLFVNGNVTNGIPPGVVLFGDSLEDQPDFQNPIYDDIMNSLDDVSEYVDKIL